MPSTARAFLVGAIAISALPPLNGFASEWLIMQGFIGSASAPQGLLRACSPLLAAGLALTGALAATCFVKAYGVAFLALPRSAHAEQATEAPLAMRFAQNGLAVACVLLGLGAPWIVAAISRAGVALDPRYPLLGAGGRLGSLGGMGTALVQPLVLGSVLLLAIGGTLLLLRRKAPKPRAALTWSCGVGTLDGRAEYTASAFAKPIRRIFARLYRPERDVEVVEGEAPYFVRRSRTRGSITPLFERLLYQPALRGLRWASDVLAPWSSSNLNRGLVLMSLTLAALLLWAST
jgi:hydrogenase-4 component B